MAPQPLGFSTAGRLSPNSAAPISLQWERTAAPPRTTGEWKCRGSRRPTAVGLRENSDGKGGKGGGKCLWVAHREAAAVALHSRTIGKGNAGHREAVAIEGRKGSALTAIPQFNAQIAGARGKYLRQPCAGPRQLSQTTKEGRCSAKGFAEEREGGVSPDSLL